MQIKFFFACEVKRGVSSAEDKSTLDSESQNKKETSKSSKKEHRRSGSDRTEDNSSKTYGSRYHKKRAIFSDIQIGKVNYCFQVIRDSEIEKIHFLYI